MCVSSCQMSDLLDDGRGSFYEKVHFWLDLSILLFQNVFPCIRRTATCGMLTSAFCMEGYSCQQSGSHQSRGSKSMRF